MALCLRADGVEMLVQWGCNSPSSCGLSTHAWLRTNHLFTYKFRGGNPAGLGPAGALCSLSMGAVQAAQDLKGTGDVAGMCVPQGKVDRDLGRNLSPFEDLSCSLGYFISENERRRMGWRTRGTMGARGRSGSTRSQWAGQCDPGREPRPSERRGR